MRRQVVVGHGDALLVPPLVLQCLGGQDGPVGVGERRLDDGARPQPPGQHDVELGGVDGDLDAEGDPGHEHQDGGERAVDRVGMPEMADHIRAQRLRQRPRQATEDRTGHQPAGRHPLGGEDAEGEEEHADVGGGHENVTGDGEQAGGVAVQAQARQQRGDGHAGPEDGQEHQRAAEPREVAGPRGPGQVPHLLHREQAGLGQADRSPGQEEEADDQADDAGAPEFLHSAGELVSDDRELVSDGLEDLMAHRRVVGRDQADQGHQDQQQRKQGNER